MNVDEDPEKLKEMLALSGGRQQVPVIVEGDKVTVGFLAERFPARRYPSFRWYLSGEIRPLGEGLCDVLFRS